MTVNKILETVITVLKIQIVDFVLKHQKLSIPDIVFPLWIITLRHNLLLGFVVRLHQAIRILHIFTMGQPMNG